tara:strand:- start:63 stop:1094 length:1032 start_codon:yes stop_codon:yes gene_type:complete
MINVAINGLGRIGKSILKILFNEKNINIVFVNDLNPSIQNLCYLVNYDSIYGNLNDPLIPVGNSLIKYKNQTLKYSNKKNIKNLNLKNVDVLIDSTGKSLNNSDITFLKKKIKHIIITNIPKKINFDYFLSDINVDRLKKNNFIISSGTCDGNAVVPIIKLLEDKVKIKFGNITTLHPWLSYQNLMDGPLKSISDPNNIYSTYVLGRSSVGNIIPKTTSVVDVASKIIKNVKSKISCLSYRVPTSIVSCAEMNFTLEKNLNIKDIKNLFHKFEKNQKYKTIRNFNLPLTSIDLKGSLYCSNIDHRWTILNGRQLRIVTWYDNEIGYSMNVVNILNKINENQVN